jgi:hypothetical protein
MANTWYDVAKWGSPLLFVMGIVANSGTGGSAVTEAESKIQITTRALMASGALEAMMMMSLMKNPATITAIGTIAGSAAKGIGGAAALL